MFVLLQRSRLATDTKRLKSCKVLYGKSFAELRNDTYHCCSSN